MTENTASGTTPLTAALLRGMALPEPEEGSKDGRGCALVVAGSAEVPGAARLAAEGTLRAGAGKLQIATVASAAVSVGLRPPPSWRRRRAVRATAMRRWPARPEMVWVVATGN